MDYQSVLTRMIIEQFVSLSLSWIAHAVVFGFIKFVKDKVYTLEYSLGPNKTTKRLNCFLIFRTSETRYTYL